MILTAAEIEKKAIHTTEIENGKSVVIHQYVTHGHT